LLDAAAAAVLDSELLLAEHKIDQGLAAARKAVELAPQSAAARFQLAQSLLAHGEPSAAETELRHARETDPDHVPTTILLARLRLDEGDAATAGTLLASVLRHEPGNLAALISEARVLTLSRQFNEAQQVVSRAMVMNGDSPQTHLVAGELAEAQDDMASALIHYQHALIRAPKDDAVMEHLTRLYQRQHLAPVKIHAMEAAAAHQPQAPAMLRIVARLYAAQGLQQDARRCLMQAESAEANY
jgi:predicted Zn-dependent protease